MVEKMRNLRHCSIRNIYLANDWVQLLELLNKVWDLGFTLLVGCSGGAYKKRGQVGFRRVYRARGLMWSASVVLHDSWCVGYGIQN